MARDLVELNVGGVHYTTHASTLTAFCETDNFFCSLFSGRHAVNVDAAGRVFVDRNGQLFQYVLDFIRTGELHLSPQVNSAALLAEFEFYGLASHPAISEHAAAAAAASAAVSATALSDESLTELVHARNEARYAAHASELDVVRDLIFAGFREAVEAAMPASVTLVQARDTLRELAGVAPDHASYSDRLEYSIVQPNTETPRTVLMRSDAAVRVLARGELRDLLVLHLASEFGLSVTIDEYVLYLKRNAQGVFWLPDVRVHAETVCTHYYSISWAVARRRAE